MHAELRRPFVPAKRGVKLGAPAHFLTTRKLGLPTHYLAVLALAAVDPEKEQVTTVKQQLCSLVRQWRAAAVSFKEPRIMPEAQARTCCCCGGRCRGGGGCCRG